MVVTVNLVVGSGLFLFGLYLATVVGSDSILIMDLLDE